MNPRFHSEVLAKVKKTIRQMAPSRPRRQSADYLVLMNIPPLMGRRDAAYDRAEQLLNNNLFANRDQERKEIYLKAVSMLEIAIRDTEAIVTALYQDDKGFKETKFLRYLAVLKNTVQAANDLVEHELSLFKEEDMLSEFIGNDITGQLRKTDEIFGESEMSIAQCVSELQTISRSQITRYREYSKKSFSRHNLERYSKAFNEFSRIYTENTLVKVPDYDNTDDE
ncbi:MAG: hypothetical protein WCV67_20995 [Victivallaceae bacterium]